jgi:hypothetical protein
VLGLVVERAAAAPPAALRCCPELDWRHRIVPIVSGGNIDAGLAAGIGVSGSIEERG